MVRGRVDVPAPLLQAFLGIGSASQPSPIQVSPLGAQRQELRLSLPYIPQRHWAGASWPPRNICPFQCAPVWPKDHAKQASTSRTVGKGNGAGPGPIPKSGLNRKKYLFPTQQLGVRDKEASQPQAGSSRAHPSRPQALRSGI